MLIYKSIWIVSATNAGYLWGGEMPIAKYLPPPKKKSHFPKYLQMKFPAKRYPATLKLSYNTSIVRKRRRRISVPHWWQTPR